ncbi:MAG: hypothetical protein ACLUNQ_07565 [Oscillospiraceae bacterium]
MGSTTLLVSLFTGLLIGMGSGVNVAVARGPGHRRQAAGGTNRPHVPVVLCAAHRRGGVPDLRVLLAGPCWRLLHTKDELMDGGRPRT